MLPQGLAALGIDSEQVLRLAIPVELRGDTLLIALCLHGELLVQAPGFFVHEGVDRAVAHDDFFRALRLRILADQCAGAAIEAGNGSGYAHGDVNFITHRNETASELRGAGFQRPKVRAPLWDRLFPEHGAVKGIASDEHPLRRHEDGDATTLVDDVKRASTRRDLRTDRRHAVMMPTPARIANPLHARRRPYEHVLRRWIAFAVVSVVRPLIHVFRPGFGDPLPCAILLHHRHAQWRQHAVDLLFGHRRCILDDEQVHVILDIRQVLAIPLGNRNSTAHTGLVDGIADRRHFSRFLGQALNLVGFIRPQLLCHRAVSAAHMDHDAAFDARLSEDV